LIFRQGLNIIARLGRFVEFSVFGKEIEADWSIIGKLKRHSQHKKWQNITKMIHWFLCAVSKIF
jgi:hypothetical protein